MNAQQLTLFDIIGEQSKVGEICYRTVLSEVYEYTVQNVYVEADRTLYILKETDSDVYKVVDAEGMASEHFFFDRDTAYSEAAFSVADIRYAKRMRVEKYECFLCIRASDRKRLTAFYAILQDGAILAKDPLTPQFIYKNASEEEAKKHLYQMIKRYKVTATTLPPLKNMYRCEENERYLYTEAICNML